MGVLEQLLAELNDQKGQKAATGTPTHVNLMGPGGVFNVAGAERDVFSTRVQPTGLLEVLPAYPTLKNEPIFEFLTGVTADETASEPSTACGDCKAAGLIKGCTQIAQFGRYCRETRELDATRLVLQQNRADPTDLRLLNNPFQGNTFTPGIARGNPFAGEVAAALMALGVSFENLLGRQLWLGNPANNLGTGYAEFPGLDILIGTGKVDALTNTACPSMDSDVKDFAYQDVCSGSPSIVETMTYLLRYVSKNARAMGLDPVDFRWAMREELFYELTSCWPCSYLSFRCNSLSADVVAQMSASDAIQMRDSMRQGRYLIVDGRRVPVILDDGIAEDTNTNNANLAAGQFASDIYLLPFSVLGNYSTLYLEYQDFSAGAGDIQLANLGDRIWWTDGGKFIWTKSTSQWCFTLTSLIKPRVILRTPFLAGRIQNVKYTPLQHTRQPFPDDGYFVNGGVQSARSVPTYYAEWSR
jgi:hypothetical protein